MSATQKPILPSSTSNFISIFDAASKEYKKLTRQDLETHPFAAVLDNCKSPDSILAIFERQANAFDEFRNGDDRIIKWLDPIVHILFTFSATLGEGIGLPFSPRKVIFAGIGVLLAVNLFSCSLTHVPMTCNTIRLLRMLLQATEHSPPFSNTSKIFFNVSRYTFLFRSQPSSRRCSGRLWPRYYSFSRYPLNQ
ncbi:hypothetical protein B0F90DRAFT_1778880 [Multifurca ochricompacta]|uniref:Fungal STAND N-terminal Goodbye domain-containing protein n=1 Tax=Multifurca ochricompacta TaxID=376703 RepID=A0AAD4LVH7_9AGAM|nr:hypothetical protein B0F90DRAFT_1778880 [Multifurca ochricompacta]